MSCREAIVFIWLLSVKFIVSGLSIINIESRLKLIHEFMIKRRIGGKNETQHMITNTLHFT
jgi:hypothetical protein